MIVGFKMMQPEIKQKKPAGDIVSPAGQNFS